MNQVSEVSGKTAALAPPCCHALQRGMPPEDHVAQRKGCHIFHSLTSHQHIHTAYHCLTMVLHPVALVHIVRVCVDVTEVVHYVPQILQALAGLSIFILP